MSLTPRCECGHGWDLHYLGCMLERVEDGDCPSPWLDALLNAAQAVLAAYVAPDGGIAISGTDRDHRQYDAMSALRDAVTASGLVG